MNVSVSTGLETLLKLLGFILVLNSVIFVNENENENGEKPENNEFVNEN